MPKSANQSRGDALDQPVLERALRDFARVYAHQTVAEALADIQQSKVQSRIVYIYVTDRDGRLKGVVPTRRLLLSPPSTPISQIMVDRVVAVPQHGTLLDACEMFVLHRLLALPIVDAERKIVGVIDVDQHTEEIQHLDERQQADEIFQLIGVRVAEVRKASLTSLFGSRFPWLLCNIMGGLACAIIAGIFQEVLDRVVVLALFIPVVLTLAESVSVQSLTLVLQRQHGRPASWKEIGQSLFRELPVGLMLGAACGVLVGGFVWVWKNDGDAAISILTSISLAVMFAAVFGTLVPLLLHTLQRDAKVAAGPITFALTDIVALTLYLGHGTWSLL